MKITLSGQVNYTPKVNMGGTKDDPQSVMEWLADIRRMVATTQSKLEKLTKEPIGIAVQIDQVTRTAIVTGQADE